jgi:murein DD-endopeptidase MepM/ murein hydrolase activator NlpD
MLLLLGCNVEQTDRSTGYDALVATFEAPEPNYIYGFPADSFVVLAGNVGRNDFLSNIMARHGVDYGTVHRMSEASKGVFDVRQLRHGHSYCVLTSPDSVAQCFIYEHNAVEYVVFDFRNRDSVQVYRDSKPVTYEERTAAGIINSSLYQTMQNQGTDPTLAVLLSEVYAWSIDFYRIQKGDKYKVIYTEKVVDGQPVGIAEIKGAWFEHFGKPYYAVQFQQGEAWDYFDEEGRSLRKAFLKAPVKFSRISSRYTMKRFHPVQKRNKPHLGTDYAAPHGTPIMATGDGTVEAAGYTSGNGNYVKIKHNGTYSTQYLHMSKFGSGIRKGVRVRQGDIIGYVGSTGLATGPHVCYRFWKNGQQVDHLREPMPPSEPVKPEHRADFDLLLRHMKQALGKH